jgi:hypothetical protein
MTDKTIKVLDEMEKAAKGVAFSAEQLYDLHFEAQYEYEQLSVESDFLTSENLAEDMEDAINAADRYTQQFHAELSEFDTQLMKLIQLRGQLAEQLDIPIGGAKWVRYETYTM